MDFVVPEGPFNLQFAWVDPFFPEKNHTQVCDYIMDRTAPAVEINLSKVLKGKVQVEGGSLIRIKANDLNSSKIRFCVKEEGKDCQFAEAVNEISFYAPPHGHWCVRYQGLDAAGNKSEVREDCATSLALETIAEIESKVYASRARDSSRPFEPLAYLLNAFERFWSLSTEEERDLVRVPLLGAVWNMALNNKIIGHFSLEDPWLTFEIGGVWGKLVGPYVIFRDVYGRLLHWEEVDLYDYTRVSVNRDSVGLIGKNSAYIFRNRDSKISSKKIELPLEGVSNISLDPDTKRILVSSKDKLSLVHLNEDLSVKGIMSIEMKEPWVGGDWSADGEFVSVYNANREGVGVYQVSQDKLVEMDGLRDIKSELVFLGANADIGVVYVDAAKGLVFRNIASNDEKLIDSSKRSMRPPKNNDRMFIQVNEYEIFVCSSAEIISMDAVAKTVSLSNNWLAISDEWLRSQWHFSDRTASVQTKDKIYILKYSSSIERSLVQIVSRDDWDSVGRSTYPEYGPHYFHIDGITGVQVGSKMKLWSTNSLIGRIHWNGIPDSESRYEWERNKRRYGEIPRWMWNKISAFKGVLEELKGVSSVRSLFGGGYVLAKKLDQGILEKILLEGGLNDLAIGEQALLYQNGHVLTKSDDHYFKIWKVTNQGLEEKNRVLASELPVVSSYSIPWIFQILMKNKQLNERDLRIPDEIGSNSAEDLIWSPNARHVAFGDGSGTLKVLELKGANLELVFQQSGNYSSRDVFWSEDGASLFVEGKAARSKCRWETTQPKLLNCPSDLQSGESKMLWIDSTSDIDYQYYGGKVYFQKPFGEFEFELVDPLLKISPMPDVSSKNVAVFGTQFRSSNEFDVGFEVQLPVDLRQAYDELCSLLRPSLEVTGKEEQISKIFSNLKTVCGVVVENP